MLVTLEDFQNFAPRVRELRSKLEKPGTEIAAQEARQFIDAATGLLYYLDWECQFDHHGTVNPSIVSGAHTSREVRDALRDFGVNAVRFAKGPSTAYYQKLTGEAATSF